VLSVTDLCAKVYGIVPSSVAKRHRVAVLRAFDQQQYGWRLDTSFRPGRVHYHTNPQHVWAVQIVRHGVLWAEATLAGLTKTKVRARYHGELVLLDRERIAFEVVYWRGVAFVSRRHGAIAYLFDQEWQRRYAIRGEAAPMPIDKACAVLGIDVDYTREVVLAAFRRAVKRVHPDVGGSAEGFQTAYNARTRLLATLGTSAPLPREPGFVAPKGVKVVYYQGARPVFDGSGVWRAS
jgi:hypothetical protein